jgi:hypothetical protein
MTLIRPGTKLPAGHPAHGKGLEGGKATAYVCNATTCSAPITDPQMLFNGLVSEPFQLIAQAQAAQMQAMQEQQQQMPAANNR